MCTAIAHAEEAAGHGEGNSLTLVLFLLTIVGGAYLLTHFVVEGLQRRFLFLSGLEYIALGVVLGPAVVQQVQPFSDLTAMGPVFAFAAGWVGLLYGLQLKLTELPAIGRPLRIAVLDVVVTGGLVTLGAQWFFQSGHVMDPASPSEAWLAAAVLGCAAAAGSSTAVDLLSERYADAETHLLPMLRTTAHLGDLLAITVYGLTFCVFHEGTTLTADPPTPAEWFLLSMGLGGLLGVLFLLYIGSDEGENTVFLAMVGILLFASGAAFFLHLSALFVNLLLGIVLAQSQQGNKIGRQLERTEGPVSLVLLLFAGALWQPVHWLPALILTLGFVGLRLIGKVLGVFLATFGTPMRGDLFRGLMAQGHVAVAMALSFQLVFDGPAVDLAYTTILCGVVVHELFSPRLLRGLLVDAGELRQDVAWSGSK